MAVEDGAALGVLLSQIKSRDEIPARLQLFQQLRIDRVSAMIVFSSVGQDESARIAEAAKPYVKGPVPSEFCHLFPARLVVQGEAAQPETRVSSLWTEFAIS